MASFLNYDARNNGCAAPFWKSTLELCYPMFKAKGKSLVDMITLLVERGLFNRENHGQAGCLDWAEFFAGTAAVSRACLKKSRHGVALDWLFGERDHDVLTSQGFRLYMDVVCSLACNALAWFGIQCSSFVQICVSVSCRGLDNDWLGDEDKDFVRAGNLQQGPGHISQHRSGQNAKQRWGRLHLRLGESQPSLKCQRGNIQRPRQTH